MLDDQSLQIAAEAAGMAMLRSYDAQAGEPHVFSARFTRKMNRLVRRTKHPVLSRVLRTAAAIVLVIAALFGTLLAASPEVRAKVFGWLHEISGIYHHYAPAETTPGETAPADVNTDYFLSVVPEGYTFFAETDIGDGKMLVYKDAECIMHFTYLFSFDNAALFIDPEEGYVEEVKVATTTATVLITYDENANNQITWVSDNGHVVFSIAARLERDDLIALAEGVKNK